MQPLNNKIILKITCLEIHLEANALTHCGLVMET